MGRGPAGPGPPRTRDRRHTLRRGPAGRHRPAAPEHRETKNKFRVVRAPPLPARDGPHGIGHGVADASTGAAKPDVQRMKEHRIQDALRLGVIY